MVAAGVLAEDDRVELIEGAIVDMTPVGARHAPAAEALARASRHPADRGLLDDVRGVLADTTDDL